MHVNALRFGLCAKLRKRLERPNFQFLVQKGPKNTLFMVMTGDRFGNTLSFNSKHLTGLKNLDFHARFWKK